MNEGIYKRGQIWWVRYSVNGKKYRESSGSRRKKDAIALRRRRLAESSQGMKAGPELDRVTFDELSEGLLAHYEINELRSIDRIRHSLKHLRGQFGHDKAVSITSDRIGAYAAARKSEGAANGTINRELTALKSMLRLGQRAGKVARVPHIEILQENNAREGFVEPHEVKAVLGELTREHQGWVEFAYITGWRKREVLSLRWQDIDDAWVRLPGDRSKNKEPRRFPLVKPLRNVIDRQREYVTRIERDIGCVITHVFCYPDGRQVRFPEQAFNNASARAGCPGLLIHDLRRSAVRNLKRAGVSETEIMKLVGLKTRSIFTRYDIVDESRLLEAADRLSALYEATPERQILPLGHKKGTVRAESDSAKRVPGNAARQGSGIRTGT
jgi:integrase